MTRCSFCNLTSDQVRLLVGGQGDVFICDKCIEIAAAIAKELPIPAGAAAAWAETLPAKETE